MRARRLAPALVLAALAAARPAVAHDPDARRAALDAALARDPSDVAALLARTELALADGEGEPALADAERAARLAPGDAAVERLRARAYLAAGEPGFARALLAPLVAAAPDDAEAWQLSARAARAEGDVAAARGALARALACSARPRPALFLELAALAGEDGDDDEALRVLTDGARRLDDPPVLVEAAAAIEERRGHLDGALAWLAREPDEIARGPRGRARRARLLSGLGRGEEAAREAALGLAALDALPPSRRGAPALHAIEQELAALALRGEASRDLGAGAREASGLGPARWAFAGVPLALALAGAGFVRRRRRAHL